MLSPLAFTLDESNTRSAYTIRNGADRLSQAVSFDEETDDPRTHFPKHGLVARGTPVDVRSVLAHGVSALPAPTTAAAPTQPHRLTVAPVRRLLT